MKKKRFNPEEMNFPIIFLIISTGFIGALALVAENQGKITLPKKKS